MLRYLRPSLVLALLAACVPAKTQTVPAWDDAGGAAGDDVMAAHDPEPGAASDAPTAGDPAPATDEVDPAPAAGTGEPPEPAQESPTAADPTPVADATPAPDPGAPAKPAVELPKPIHSRVDSSCGKDSGIGQKLKPFDLKDLAGKPVSNKTYRGRVVLVNFWGTWCKPCLKELPEFEQLYRRYRKAGLTLVAMATDTDPAPVQEFVDSRKLSAKIVLGAEDYAGQYASNKFPFSFVVDDKGVIRGSYRGYKPECMGKLEADIRAQLEARVSK